MKRNNLMKRMAVVALAATMSVGMAVPAMAGVSATITDNGSHGSATPQFPTSPTAVVNHKAGYEVTDWYVLDSFKDQAQITFFNNEITGSAVTLPDAPKGFGNDTITGSVTGKYEHAKDFLIEEDADSPLYVNSGNSKDYAYISNGPIQKYDTTPVGVAGVSTFTFKSGVSTDDKSYYVEWTVTAQNDNYFDAEVDGRTLTLTPKKFGTTVYKYTGKLYHNGKYVGSGADGDVSGYFAVTMPLNKYTLQEVAEDSLTVRPNVASNSKAAATAATQAVQAGLDARDPKILNLIKEDTLLKYVTSWENKKHELVATVDNVTNYHLDTATNTGSFKGHVTVVDKTDNNKEYDLGIETFSIKPDDTPAFDDVASTAYYYDAVVWGVKNGVVKGTSATTFSPYDTFTREQVALMLYRLAGSPEVDYTNVETVKFHDIGSLSEESKKAIAWGVQNGIIKGTSDVTFGPKEGITRGQLVTLLYRASGDTAEYNEDGFTDVEHGKYYEDAVNWAVAKGVTTGTTATTFSPNAVTTRAQGITFLFRNANLK